MRALPLLLALYACAPPQSDGRADDPGRFSVVVIPDSQIYADSHPEVLERHVQWIVDHQAEHDIRFVTHVGDIVNDGADPRQWENAARAFAPLLDADIPHGFSVAAHDYGTWGEWPVGTDSSCMPDPENGLPRVDCDFTAFMERFGPDTYAGRDWFAGASPSGRSSYQLIEAEGLKLLFLHLPEDAPEEEVVWGEGVLAAHPDALAHLTTHRLIFDYRLTDAMPSPLDLFVGGRFNALTYAIGDQGLRFKDGADAESHHQRLVVAQPNVWGVHCGHVDGEFRLSSANARGLPVHEVLTDFQDMSDGGGGLLRVLTFDVNHDSVDAWTVSTETGRRRENGEGFDHSLDILEAYKGTAFGELGELGFDTSVYDQLFAELLVEGSDTREMYRASLYDRGERDSSFTLDVPFSDYVSSGE
jgi:hypothetical protein